MTAKTTNAFGAFREVTTGVALLALSGSSVGGFLGMVAIAAKALR